MTGLGKFVLEAAALISCAEWLASIAAGERSVVNLRPANDLPDTDYVGVDQDRVIRVLRRIAYDLEELARARRVADLSSSANAADAPLRLRRRLAEPPIELSRSGKSIHQSHQAWENYEASLQRAGIPVPLNPYRHLDRSGK